jgi:hypothetical protein
MGQVMVGNVNCSQQDNDKNLCYGQLVAQKLSVIAV